MSVVALPCRFFLAAFSTLLLQYFNGRAEIIAVDLNHVRTGAMNSMWLGGICFKSCAVVLGAQLQLMQQHPKAVQLAQSEEYKLIK